MWLELGGKECREDLAGNFVGKYRFEDLPFLDLLFSPHISMVSGTLYGSQTSLDRAPGWTWDDKRQSRLSRLGFLS